MRATAATNLARKGESIKNVQAYLGHSDIQTTLKYYVHLIDDDKIATAETMGDILAGCSEKCSQGVESSESKIISINSILDEKCAIK